MTYSEFQLASAARSQIILSWVQRGAARLWPCTVNLHTRQEPMWAADRIFEVPAAATEV